MKPMSAMKAIREDTASDKAAAEANQSAIGHSVHSSIKCPHCGKFSATPQGYAGHKAADKVVEGSEDEENEDDHNLDDDSEDSEAAEPKTKGALGHRNEQPYANARKAVKTRLAAMSKRDGQNYK